MAKSAGNYYTLDDVVRLGFDPLAFRYQCLLAHYRTRMNFTLGALRQAAEAFDHLRQRIRCWAQFGGGEGDLEPWRARFRERIADDLDLPGALSVLQRALAEARLSPAAKLAFALECDEVLALGLADVARERDALDLPSRNRLEAHVALRRRKDYPRADATRVIAGHVVEDHVEGSLVARRDRRLGRRPRRTISSPAEVAAGERGRVEWSVCVLTRDWRQDLQRCLLSVLRYLPASGEVLVLDDGSTDDSAPWLESRAREDRRLTPIFADRPLGEGRARNALARAARGRLQLHLDPSVELTGDLFDALALALAAPQVGFAGPWGLRTSDLKDFEEVTSGDVQAVQGYCVAARSDTLAALGGFDERFRFYRNLDVAMSFAARAAGQRNVAVGADRATRHTHRAWEALQPEERERRSRKNFDRFLRRFGRRRDLLVIGR